MIDFKIHKLNLPEDKDWKRYQSFLPNNVKNVPGVYFFFDKDLKLIYIGKAQNLRSRIGQHVSKYTERRWDPEQNDDEYNNAKAISKLPLGIVEYYAFIEEESRLVGITESIFVRILKPKHNIKKPRECWEEAQNGKETS